MSKHRVYPRPGIIHTTRNLSVLVGVPHSLGDLRLRAAVSVPAGATIHLDNTRERSGEVSKDVPHPDEVEIEVHDDENCRTQLK